MRRAAALLVIVIAQGLVIGSVATAAGQSLSLTDSQTEKWTDARDVVEHSRHRTNAITVSAGSRSLTAVIRELGIDGPAHIAPPFSPGTLSVPSGPARAAVADILAQVAYAEQLVVQKRGDRLPTLDVLLGNMSEALAPEPLRAETPAAYARRSAESASAVLAEAATGTDVAAILSAGRDITASLDRGLGDLQAYADALPPRQGPPEAGCDVVDVVPLICIGGTGDNVHANAHHLVIDLGGDDAYTQTVSSQTVETQGVFVTVDLGGNDVYQGAAHGGAGVGIAVDTAGDDRYAQTVTVDGGVFDPGRATGLGMGILGFGLLWDGEGDDAYSLHAESHGLTQLHGLAVAWGGLGAVIDLGQGTDDYRSALVRHQGRSTLEAAQATGMTTQGFALGAGVAQPVVPGIALLYDDGGNSEHAVTADIGNPGSFGAYGQAAAMPRGEALVVTGPGDTQRTLSMDHRLTSALLFYGQGYANAGYTVLRDLGGNDRYTMDSRRTYLSEVTTADGDATAEMVQGFPFPGRSLYGQGSVAGIGGVAVVVDDHGDDEYRATTALRYEARAAVVAPSGAVPAGDATATAIGPGVRIQAQGTTFGGIAPYTAGVLADAAGDDRYLVEGTVAVLAAATNQGPGLTHGEARVGADSPQESVVFAQGSGGGGGLLDDGGTDDFRVVNRSRAEASPTRHLGKAAPVEVRAHGANQGVLVDLGASSTFSVEPNFGAASGRYGEGEGTAGGRWTGAYRTLADVLDARSREDAGPTSVIYQDTGTHSFGMSTGVREKQPGNLAFAMESPVTLRPGRNDVTVALSDAEGMPVAGAALVLGLFERAECSAGTPGVVLGPCPPTHTPLRTATVFTDAGGTATFTLDGSGLEAHDDRVLAVVDSGTNLRRSTIVTIPARVVP